MPPCDEEDGGDGGPPGASDDAEDGGPPGPDKIDAACVAADGTVSASPTTSRTSDGFGDQIWSTMTTSPVPVRAMSLMSCQAICHFKTRPLDAA